MVLSSEISSFGITFFGYLATYSFLFWGIVLYFDIFFHIWFFFFPCVAVNNWTLIQNLHTSLFVTPISVICYDVIKRINLEYELVHNTADNLENCFLPFNTLYPFCKCDICTLHKNERYPRKLCNEWHTKDFQTILILLLMNKRGSHRTILRNKNNFPFELEAT